jgi:hypothetical protein
MGVEIARLVPLFLFFKSIARFHGLYFFEQANHDAIRGQAEQTFSPHSSLAPALFQSGNYNCLTAVIGLIFVRRERLEHFCREQKAF